MKFCVSWRPLVQSAVLVALLGLQSGCGGGGASSSGGGGSSSNGVAALQVSVTLPTGVSAPSGGLSLSGALFDNVKLSGTTGKISSWTGDRQLVGLVDSQNRPVMIGFVGPGHATISAQSTAVALTYFALAAYGAQPEAQEAILEQLEQDSNVATAATSVATTLTTSGNLSPSNAVYRSAIVTAAAKVLGGAGALSPNVKTAKAKPLAIAINPSGTTKSGATVSYGATDSQIAISNTFRRRVMVFVDQSSTTDSAGNTTSVWNPISSAEVAPAKGEVSPWDIYGNLGSYQTETSSGAITIPALASGLMASDYTVTVAGPGETPTTSPNLTNLEQAALSNFLERAFVKDYFLPLFNVMAANSYTASGNSKVAAYVALESAVDSNAASVQAFVSSTFPTSVVKMDNGDYTGAFDGIISSLSSANISQLVTFYSGLASSTGIPTSASGSRIQTVIGWMSQAIASPTSVLQALSSANVQLPQQIAVNNSNTFDTWDVKISTAKVTLTPASSQVSNSTPTLLTTPLTANVTVPGGVPSGSTLSYSWSTTAAHGDITVDGVVGTKFPNASTNLALYGATTGLTASTGTDTVTVEVTMTDGQGNVTKLGGATSTVTVVGTGQVNLIPQNVSVQPSASTFFTTQLNSGMAVGTSPGTVQFQYTLAPAALGTVSAGTSPTTAQNVTFIAASQTGTGTLTCSLIDNSTGKAIASSTSNIRVETTPTIVHGSLEYGGRINSAGRADWGIWVKFPVVAGAKTVSLHCYNFNDTAYWGTSVYGTGTSTDGGKTWNWSGGDDIAPDGSDSGPAGSDGNLYLGLTGGEGPAPLDLGGVAANANSRFGGMIVEATFGY